MTIEDIIFKRYSPNIEKMKKFGFKKLSDSYVIEQFFKDDAFKYRLTVTLKGLVSGVVYDVENNDEFLPLRIEGDSGAFIGNVREEYEKSLIKIRDNCFEKKYFIYPQSNRITSLIIEKYGNEPEFLWDKFQGSGIFRNDKTAKWYAAILDTDRSRLQPDKNGMIEVINVKLSPEHVTEIIKNENFYPAYHMNKKSWISVILDETVADNAIMKLIEESYYYSDSKKH